jgi:hypothetical protein
MQTVNALLRSELAAAHARLDAAGSPPLRQRPDLAAQNCTAPSRGPLTLRATCDSSESSDSDAQSPRSSSCSDAGSTDSSSAESRPRTSSGDPPGKDLAQEARGTRATTPHWPDAAAPDQAQCQHRVPAMHDDMALLLVSMTALQLRLERQLASSSSQANIAHASEAEDQRQHTEQVPSASEATIAEVMEAHAQNLRELEQRLRREHADACQHMREEHAAELAAASAVHAAELECVHADLAADLARQHADALAAEGKRISSRLTKEHVETLEGLREPLQREHAAAMQALQQQHTQNLAESRAAAEAELKEQHAAALDALTVRLEQQHAAAMQSLQQKHAEQAEQARLQMEQKSAEERSSLEEAMRAQQVENAQQAEQARLKVEQEMTQERSRLKEEHERQLALARELAAEQNRALQGGCRGRTPAYCAEPCGMDAVSLNCVTVKVYIWRGILPVRHGRRM